MPKTFHEIRDPIHVFVRLDSDERLVLDSLPFQRLRHIQQLGLTSLVYPAATHKRFEHSLGVMELADRVFGVVTGENAVTDEIRDLIPEVASVKTRDYWRGVLRLAALCHDLGHLPFSHSAEKELLPDGWDHERLTREIIESAEMRHVWDRLSVPIRPQEIVKLALGPRKATDLDFSTWETILAEIITGDAFGVDRMDYLLRDSHHIGVAYGRFDHFRLIDTLRILPSAQANETGASREPALGVEEGGIRSAEALMIARYFMYSQVYYHPIRRIYDIHLQDFLAAWLHGSKFSTSVKDHLQMTDDEVTASLRRTAETPGAPGSDPARRIVSHDHFKLLYQRNPLDIQKNPKAGLAVFEAAKQFFGPENTRFDSYREKGSAIEFPVLTKDKRIVPSIAMSEPLKNLPVLAVDYVFIHPNRLKEAERWRDENRAAIIEPKKEESP